MKLGATIILFLAPLCAEEYMTSDVLINGAGPFRLLIDTGAASTSLSPAASRKAGLQPSYAVQLVTINGEKTVPAARAHSVAAGQSLVANVEVLIADPTAIRAAVPNADGVLGQSFLSQTPWMIDYRNGRFVTGELAVRFSNAMQEILCERAADSRLVFPIRIGRAEFKVALDSGTNALVLHCGAECPILEDVDSSRRILTNSGQSPVRVGRLRNSIEAGPLAFQRKNTVLIESAPSDSSTHGVLPASWFAAVFVDPGSGTMRLSR